MNGQVTLNPYYPEITPISGIEAIETDLGELWFPIGDNLGIRENGTYVEAYPEKEFMKRVLRSGDIFVDVGAHCGYMSRYAEKLGCEVYAFEPHPTNYRCLVANIPKAHTYKAAVSYNNGYQELYESTNNSGDHIIGKQGPTHKAPEKNTYIHVTALDRKIEKANFIKIDVQGYEKFVLEGAKRIIEDCRPYLMIEYSPWHLQLQGLDPHRFLNYIYSYHLIYDVYSAGNPFKVPSPMYTMLYMEPN